MITTSNIIASKMKLPGTAFTSRCRFVENKSGIYIKTLKKSNSPLVSIKELWPDIESGYQKYSDIFTKCSTEELAEEASFCFKKLHINNSAKILEVGALRNDFISKLNDLGHQNSFGIDTSEKILNAHHGRRINIRDLKLSERYDVIYLSLVLDYLPGGCFNDQLTPSKELFALKIRAHLNKGGYIFIFDHDNLKGYLSSVLKGFGLKKINCPGNIIFDIWRSNASFR